MLCFINKIAFLFYFIIIWIPLAYILPQREEEERKEDDRKRAGEERRRRERERIQKERKEAEERDRKMNEKLQMIEEQRSEVTLLQTARHICSEVIVCVCILLHFGWMVYEPQPSLS